MAASVADFNLLWEGEGLNEVGRDTKSGRIIVEINPKYCRPPESNILSGNPAKAAKKLGWKPKTSFQQLVEIMMRADLKLVGPPC